MKIGIIGHGRFGALWAYCMKKFGDVVIHDKENENLEEVLNVDLLFLLVPISEIKNVCKEISDKLNENTIVVDACSVKVKPVEGMKSELKHSQPIIATHPLFGPDSVKRLGLEGQKIVVSKVRVTEGQLSFLESMLKKMKLEIIHATPEEHDRQMARSQALVHFLGRGLGDLKLEDQQIATPDYNSLLEINDLVNNDTWELFFDMQLHNPFAREIREELLTSLKNLESKIESYE
ncbi:prephenate dehydrogenase [Candidatus Parcubacteria bacterium]|jgi:prephenate dehydrogenase|nr:prephenate dehydrogenase [Candidatus Parcubacteria bacterium]MBT3949101.1 prephenate dehydrogenase [Candidatus Parcubacteria bacterium]